MAAGWLVMIEVEAGRGEFTPMVFAVAVEGGDEAVEAARNSPDVVEACHRPRTGDRPWPITRTEIVHPLDAQTVARLGLARNEIWNVYKPWITDRMAYATKP